MVEGLFDIVKPKNLSGKFVLAKTLPVARVAVNITVPHLDKVFDYFIPEDMSEIAQIGVRVVVRFGNRQVGGYIVDRVQISEFGQNLSKLLRVVSAEIVLKNITWKLVQAIAQRYAGTVADVLQVAIPPTKIRVEKEEFVTSNIASLPVFENTVWENYQNGESFLSDLVAGKKPRAVFSALQSFGVQSWGVALAQALVVAAKNGLGALAILPDQKDVDFVADILTKMVGVDNFVQLSANLGGTKRYRNFLRLTRGTCFIAIGTRSASYVPIKNLGLLVCWNDGDSSHSELRAPYQHVREILLLRSKLENTAILFGSVARSIHTQRLVEIGWAKSITAQRAYVKTLTARVVNTADSVNSQRDPLALAARLPSVAWHLVKESLLLGAVLVQVARTGYQPSLACQVCKEIARCLQCSGPLAKNVQGLQPQCCWCGVVCEKFSCIHCGGGGLRAVVTGADRTAEELGKAFVGARIVTATGKQKVNKVFGKNVLVVATIGAEPVVEEGYKCVLLLDGVRLLLRESLNAVEETLRFWFSAASLAKSAAEGGVVVVTAWNCVAVQSLVQWNPQLFAVRELKIRQELHLPPSGRVAVLFGELEVVESFLFACGFSEVVEIVGPVVYELSGNQLESLNIRKTEFVFLESNVSEKVFSRAILRFPYKEAENVIERLRNVLAAYSVSRKHGVVQIRVDGTDII